MTLRNKTVISIAITLATLLAILSIVSKVVLIGNVEGLEDQTMRKNTVRALQAMTYKISVLDSTAYDWAARGVTYDFKNNMLDQTFSELKVNFIIITDSSGRIIYGRGFDLESKKNIPVPASLRELLTPGNPLAKHVSAESSVKGVINLPEGPLMVASRPITTGAPGGHVRGTLIMGRYLDREAIEQLAHYTYLSLTILQVSDPEIPPGLKNSGTAIPDEGAIAVSPLNNDYIAGYAPVKDIYGNPALVLKVTVPRSIYREGKASVYYFMLAVLAVFLIFSVLIVLLLEKMILSRLARLSCSISAIGARGDFSGRLEITGNDELSSLVKEVNGMLAALDQSRSDLNKSEERYRSLVENSPDIIYSLNNKSEITSMNQSGLTLLGCSSMDCLSGKHFTDCLHPGDWDKALEMLENGIASRKSVYKGLEVRLINNRGETIFVEANMIMLYNSSGEYEGMFGTIRDITQRLRVEEELSLQKAYFRQLFENSPEGIAILDNDDHFININKGFERLFQYSAEETQGRRLGDLIVPEKLMEEAHDYSSSVCAGNVLRKETVRKRKDGSLINVLILAYPIVIDSKPAGIFGIYNDITERKQAEENLKYLSLHDPLTGVYNRAYFEQEMKRIQEGRLEQSGIILCDLDGLKFVNDTLGHDSGDLLLAAASRIIKEAFRENDMIARIGGDEFAVLLPGSDRKTVEQACGRIRQAIEDYNRKNPKLPLSISIGYAHGSREKKSMGEMFKEADNNMYREKLLHSQSTRSSIVRALIKALEDRDFMHDGHADRLQDLVSKMGKALGLQERNIADLRLLAQFHDIGKVGIPDRILFKPGPLSGEETREMLRHSEIGHRIAQSTPDLATVADWILKHHEWWNGKGYPLSLKGEEIPLECRIMAIADAYDAMTSHRPYRQAMSHEYAVNELKKCAGTQFDPNLVNIFILAMEIENIKHN